MSDINDIPSAVLVQITNLGIKLREDLEPRVDGGESAPLSDQVRLYMTMDALLDACKEITTCLNKLQPIVADRITKQMVQNEMDEAKFFGKIFRPDTKNYISIKGGYKEMVLSFLKSHNVGRELVKEEVHPATLAKFIEEHFLDQGKEIPDGITCFSKPVLKVTTSRSKS